MKLPIRTTLLLLLLATATPATAQVTSAGGGSNVGGRGLPMPPIVMIPPLPEGTGAITGVVVDAGSGQPLAGAVVTISVPSRAPIGRASSEITDEAGRFAFTKLPAGSDFQISASKAGYFESGYGRDSLRSPTGARIQLADGQWMDRARVSLWRAGAISGAVVDERGAPIVGIYVRALADVQIAGTRHLAGGPIALTDDRGMYRIPGLGPGSYLVSVPSVSASVPMSLDAIFQTATAPFAVFDPSGSRLALTRYPIPPPPVGGQLFAYPITFAPGTASAATATTIALDAGDERTGVNLTLDPVPAARLSGRVDGPAEVTTGLTVRLVAAGLEDLGSGSEAATAAVAPDGSFTFLSVPAGAYTLDAKRTVMEFVYNLSSGMAPRLPLPPSVGGWGMSSGNIAALPPGLGYSAQTGGGSQDTFWGRTAVTLAGRDVAGILVTMRRAVTLSGTTTFENPPANPPTFFSSAEPANGSPALGLPRTVRRPDLPPNEFVLEGLLSGSYFLRIRTGGYIVKSIVWNGADYTNRPFDASEGRDVSGVRVTLSDRAPKLSGTVRGHDRSPVTDAAVIVFPVQPDQWSNYGFAPATIVSARTSTAGVYSVSSLPAGDYFVVGVPASDVSAWQRPDFLKQAARSAVRVSLAWGQTATVDVTIVR
jgi:hypothetical protein